MSTKMIDEKATKEKFGYYSGEWNPKSNKRIVCVCDKCGKTRETGKHQYRALCHSCTMKGRNKGRNNPHWKGGKVEVECLECGKVFLVRRDEVKRGRGKYCSKKCRYPDWSKNKSKKRGKWRRGSIERKCKECGKPFLTSNYKIKRGQGIYCSNSCRAKACMRHHKFPNCHTKPELNFEDICERNNLPFHYVGDGQLWIGKKGGTQLNPDFIEANDEKILVEVMGLYWHSPLLNRNLRESATLEYRKSHFKRYKWRPIFIWDTDLLREDAEEFVLKILEKK